MLRDRFLEGWERYRCLTGKCYPKSEVMKLKSISREEQLERLRNLYGQWGSEGKARLLDEFCEQYGYHRKHAIRLLNGNAVAKKSPPEPEPQHECISQLVERIWTAGEQPCGKRLAPMLPLWLPHYQRHMDDCCQASASSLSKSARRRSGVSS